MSYTSFHIDRLKPADSYKLFMGSVIPRPIAFVSTLSPNGAVNLAPFSNFMMVSSSSGMLAFSVGTEGGSPREKDTYANIKRAREFVVNIASIDLAKTVQNCSEPFPPEVSEVCETGLSTLPSVAVQPPRIAECKVHFECSVHDIHAVGTAHLIVGKALVVHVNSEIVADYKVDPRALAPLGRIGGRRYVEFGKFIDV